MIEIDQWKIELDDASSVMRQATDRIALDAALIEQLRARLVVYEARIRKYQVTVDECMDANWTPKSIQALEDVFWYELGLAGPTKTPIKINRKETI